MAISSSKAHLRNLSEWVSLIQQGMVQLPRFQRYETWVRRRIESFLNTILNDLPLGITLLLNRGSDNKFHSRYLSGAELGKVVEPKEYLLDGQQRLTAFWRFLHNNYDFQTFISARAKLMAKAAEILCTGKNLNISEVAQNER